MRMYYKVNICQKLREAGYTSYSLQKAGILSTTMWTRLAHCKSISWRTLDKICALLEMQPGELIGYEHENKERIEGYCGNLLQERCL